MPEFDPEKGTYRIKQWIHKLEQLQEIYGWTETGIIFHMQAKLRGLAKEWYDHLEDYLLTWDQWKANLEQTFPDKQKHVNLVKHMLARNKEEKENYRQYYFAKKGLLQPCKFTPQEEVSYIIEGITDKTIQIGAKSGHYEAPEKLYADYLVNVASEEDKGRDPQRGKSKSPVICFTCNQQGHLARNCSGGNEKNTE